MTVETKLSNAYKIFILKNPSYIGKPSLKELKKSGLIDNVDLDEDDLIEENIDVTEYI